MKAHPAQGDLFGDAVYPSRMASERVDGARLRSTLKREMARAIRQCPHDRYEIALRMAHILGLDHFSKATLDAYTAESKENHDISLVRFSAFVRATGATWLWDAVVAQDGLTMLDGDEARLAEIARLQQEQRALATKLKTLRAVPVTIKRCRS